MRRKEIDSRVSLLKNKVRAVLDGNEPIKQKKELITEAIKDFCSGLKCLYQVYYLDDCSGKFKYYSICMSIEFYKSEEPLWQYFKNLDWTTEEWTDYILFQKLYVYKVEPCK